MLGFALVVMIAVIAWRSVPGRFGSPEVSRASNQSSLWLQGSASDNLALLAGQSQEHAPAVKPGRLIYPYSVIPGGVQDSYELERASVRDHLVSQHFAGFENVTGLPFLPHEQPCLLDQEESSAGTGRETDQRWQDCGAHALRESGIGKGPEGNLSTGTANLGL